MSGGCINRDPKHLEAYTAEECAAYGEGGRVAPVRVGDRVRITGILPNDPAPLEIGDEGTVDWVNYWTSDLTKQFNVRWDSGRRLGLVDGDPYVVVTP